MWKFESHFGKNAVVTDQNIAYTYEDLAQAGAELCSHIPQRSLVVCLCDNVFGALLGYTAFMRGGMVPMLLEHDLDFTMLQGILEKYHPPYVWAPAAQADAYGKAEKVYAAHNYCLLKTGYGPAPALHKDLALLLTTSGSTGSPKFVRQTYANIRANTDSIVQYLELTDAERAITTLPMSYTYGLSIITSHLAAGACILLTNHPVTQREFWTFFREYGATSFGGVPYTYEILQKLHFQRMELPSLRSMTQAGGKLSAELHRSFAQYALDTNRRFYVMYGQCEATARMGYLPYDKSLEKAGSMGIAIPGGKFELVDAKGNIISADNENGELVYYGDNVTMGYAEEAEDLALGDERHGILHTGDVAYRDEDGFYYITGRLKRFLKIFGNRVNLDELERLLKAQFPQTECACGGVDDRLSIFTTSELLMDEMKAYAAQKTGLPPVAFSGVAVPSIPKNSAGKTLYAQLQKMLEGE